MRLSLEPQFLGLVLTTDGVKPDPNKISIQGLGYLVSKNESNPFWALLNFIGNLDNLF